MITTSINRLFVFSALLFLPISNANAQFFKLLKKTEQVEFSLGPNLYHLHYKGSPTDKVFMKPGISVSTDLLFHTDRKVNFASRFYYE